MANSIDFTTLALGALVGIGCRKQLRTAGRVAANTVASLAGVAAQAAAEVAKETKSSEQQSAPQGQPVPNGQAGGENKNG